MTRLDRVRRSLLAAAVAGAVLAAPLASFAQTQPMPTPPASAPAAGQPGAAPEAPKWPDFNTVVKDMTPSQGLFTLYRYKAEDNSKDQTRLLCQIPRSLMKQDLLLATSISRGPMAGYQWDDYLVRFEIQGKMVIIRVPDTRYVTDPKKDVNDVVSRTYNDAFLTALPIVTYAPGGDPVVELGGPLLAPLVNLPAPSGPFAAFSPRRDMSTFDKVKVFPDNVLIDADIALAGRSGAGMSVGITYSFRRLPAVGSFQPRIADERVGYFTTARQDWGMKWSERENLIRYVNRWDLKKKDPSLELSPPEKPIVFIIEKTVPLQWRKYVGEGIAEWNKAYEKLGIVGAIVVQQQTDDNEFANVDPEDARYNFIRWIVTGRGFAMGPSRADPRTGQILDADIIFDDSMLRFYFREFETFGPAPVAAMMGPEFTQFLIEHPEFIPQGMTKEQVQDAARSLTSASAGDGNLMYDAPAGAGQLPADALQVLQGRRLSPARTECNYAVGMQQQLAMAHLAVAATGKKIPDRFIGEVIREIVAHEVGHTLGLRHNFKASSWLSEAEIKRRRDTTDEPLVASVMDYNPVVYFAGDDIDKIKHLQTPGIGPYDYWAIEYGYKPVDKGDEKAMLQQIASQGTKREYAYATDEDTMGLTSVDPMVNRFDLTEDPIAWSKSRVILCDQLLKNIKTWAVKGNEPNYHLRSTYLTLMSEKARDMMFVSRLVGGQNFNRNRAGDPGAKPALQLLEPKRQREARNALETSIFKDDFFNVESELLNELPPSRWMDWYSNPMTRIDFPAHQTVQSMQAFALLSLTSPQVLQRVYDAELKSKAEDKFTAAELITRVKQMIWGNLTTSGDQKFTDAKPMTSSLRRNLQRQYVQYMLNIAESKPGALVSADLQSMASYSMEELSDNIGKLLAQANGQIDFATKAHLSQTKSQIDRTLNAPHIQVPGFGGGQIIIMDQPTPNGHK